MGRNVDTYNTLYRSGTLLRRVVGLIESGTTHRPLWLSVVEANPPEPAWPCGAGVAPALHLPGAALRKVFAAHFPAATVGPAFVRLKTDTPTELKRFAERVQSAQAAHQSHKGPLTSAHPAVALALTEFAAKYDVAPAAPTRDARVLKQDTFTLTRFFSVLEKPSASAGKSKPPTEAIAPPSSPANA